MKILAVESSCDETSAAIVKADKNAKQVELLSNITASSLPMHAQTGGIIPENAAREQLKYILPVIKEALSTPGVDAQNIDAIAVTIGPGLIGSLLIGVETAKTLAYAWNKPIIPVNHLFGHIYANFVQTTNEQQLTANENLKVSSHKLDVIFPAIVLVVSGGHTDLLLMKNHQDIKWLGGTRDDAAGEAFDKIGRLLNLPYPGGPEIEKAALSGRSDKYKLPRPLIDSGDFDFSFSGLKTAALREIQAIEQLDNDSILDISASVQQAIIDVLIKKTLKAAQEYKVKSILLSGGVAANDKLRSEFESEVRNQKLEAKLFFPEKKFCTDNAAMIGAAAFFNYHPVGWNKVEANPELYFD